MKKLRAQMNLSGYASFHFRFIGYNFYDKQKKKVRPKFVLWNTCKAECIKMTYREHATERFTLIDREGWLEGYKLTMSR